MKLPVCQELSETVGLSHLKWGMEYDFHNHTN